jgi:hypothetical protein
MKLLYYVLLVIIALVIIIVIAIKLNRKNNQTSRSSRSSSSDSVRPHETDGPLLHNPAYLENPLAVLKNSFGQVDEEQADLWGKWGSGNGGKHKCKKRVKKPQKLKKSSK